MRAAEAVYPLRAEIESGLPHTPPAPKRFYGYRVHGSKIPYGLLRHALSSITLADLMRGGEETFGWLARANLTELPGESMSAETFASLPLGDRGEPDFKS